MFQWTTRRLHRPNPGAILLPVHHSPSPHPSHTAPFPLHACESLQFIFLSKYIFIELTSALHAAPLILDWRLNKTEGLIWVHPTTKKSNILDASMQIK